MKSQDPSTRVSEEQISAAIVREQYTQLPGTTLTVCALTLRNGFVVTGESACADPENFDADYGRKLAFDQARRKIWALEGYLLRERLFASSAPTPEPSLQAYCWNLRPFALKAPGWLLSAVNDRTITFGSIDVAGQDAVMFIKRDNGFFQLPRGSWIFFDGRQVYAKAPYSINGRQYDNSEEDFAILREQLRTAEASGSTPVDR